MTAALRRCRQALRRRRSTSSQPLLTLSPYSRRTSTRPRAKIRARRLTRISTTMSLLARRRQAPRPIAKASSAQHMSRKCLTNPFRFLTTSVPWSLSRARLPGWRLPSRHLALFWSCTSRMTPTFRRPRRRRSGKCSRIRRSASPRTRSPLPITSSTDTTRMRHLVPSCPTLRRKALVGTGLSQQQAERVC